MTNDFSLMIHGGAGELSNVDASERRADYLDSMRITLEYGRAILEQGGAALEAVEICTSLLEDDPLFNAGIGSVLNEDGKVEMDAAIMCGATLAAGAVAGVRNIANPIQLARMVLAESVHVMLIGEGAMRFADSKGVKTVPDDYCITPERRTQWEEACRAQCVGLDHDSPAHQQKRERDKLGTVGAVARDCEGRLAAAASTGGTVNKHFGRVGDSPIIGAGVYADDET
ncbi:MAG: isoaspartyl peptidase/L-asparaginase, partial [Chromatiales bacterium]|nr:isoaspartyl peptidase/L-asparaginase [Chromatiales bacterium]